MYKILNIRRKIFFSAFSPCLIKTISFLNKNCIYRRSEKFKGTAGREGGGQNRTLEVTAFEAIRKLHFRHSMS